MRSSALEAAHLRRQLLKSPKSEGKKPPVGSRDSAALARAANSNSQTRGSADTASASNSSATAAADAANSNSNSNSNAAGNATVSVPLPPGAIARRLHFAEGSSEELMDGGSSFLSLASELHVYDPEDTEGNESQEVDLSRKSGEAFVNLLRSNLDVHRKICEWSVELQTNQRSALTHHFLSSSEMEKKWNTVSKAIEGLSCFLQNKDNAIYRLLHQSHPQEWIPVELEDQANFIDLLKRSIENHQHSQSYVHLIQWYNNTTDVDPLTWAESLSPLSRALMLCRLNHRALLRIQKHTSAKILPLENAQEGEEDIHPFHSPHPPSSSNFDVIRTPPNLPASSLSMKQM